MRSRSPGSASSGVAERRRPRSVASASDRGTCRRRRPTPAAPGGDQATVPVGGADLKPDTAGPRPIEDRLAAAGLPPLPRTAWLEIDLDALAANLAIARELAGPGVLVEPVVKADAYGHGMVPIARALAEAGADGLCVATFDEAIALRSAGIEAGVTVLYPIPPALAPEAARAADRRRRGRRGLLAARSSPRSAAAGPGRGGDDLSIELEIETGLGRGGVAAGCA